MVRPAPPDPLSPAVDRERDTTAVDAEVRLGTLDKAYLIWLAGASCDGCSVGVTGATAPRLEQLLTGDVPGLPRVVLMHTDFSIESGTEYTETLLAAERGELDAPYVVTFEGAVLDESTAGTGFWSGLGADPVTGRQITSSEWLSRLAPGAAAIVAIGTCAAFGGVPAARGNATGAMGVPDWLGPGFQATSQIPLVTVPGCAPPGDNYVETVAAILLFLNGLGPMPQFDELGRPAWLYDATVHYQCPRTDSYLAGVFAAEYGGAECLIELGCCGPLAVCNIGTRGMIDGEGGCMRMGGICIGCTMPGFPDAFLEIARPREKRPTVFVTSGSFRRRVTSHRRPRGGAKVGAEAGRARIPVSDSVRGAA